MKIVYFATYYPAYLNQFYRNNIDSVSLTYEQQLEGLISDSFGVFGPYVYYANKLGNNAQLIVANASPMQKRWALENNVKYSEKNWIREIAIAQIKAIKPDIFFMGSMFDFYGEFLDEIRSYCRVVYGWIACPIPSGINLKQMDLILTSVPEYITQFRELGINSELLPAAFDANILNRIPVNTSRDINFSFIGGFSQSHQKRREYINGLIKMTPLKLFGYGINKDVSFLNKIKSVINPNTIENRYGGEVWGIKMYELLKRSKITFNIHIDMALGNRVNMRMYEATGMGSLLLTDKGENSNLNYFESGKEVVEYTSLEDAIEKYNYYISHDKEREAIAKKGQERTLRDYNFVENVNLMIGYFKKYLK